MGDVEFEMPTKFQDIKEYPYLDSGLAIGLVFQDKLRAFGGAHMEGSDRLKIVQLQGWLGDLTGSKARFRSGLYGGFSWRGTLVNAWQALAPVLGANSIGIVSAILNSWSSGDNYPSMLKGYDAVAQNMGFEFDETTGNWVKPL
jgi:hypothetical protein